MYLQMDWDTGAWVIIPTLVFGPVADDEQDFKYVFSIVWLTASFDIFF